MPYGEETDLQVGSGYRSLEMARGSEGTSVGSTHAMKPGKRRALNSESASWLLRSAAERVKA